MKPLIPANAGIHDHTKQFFSYIDSRFRGEER